MKKKTTKLLSMLLSMLMVLSLLAACGGNSGNSGNTGGNNQGGSDVQNTGSGNEGGEDVGGSQDANQPAEGEKIFRDYMSDTPTTYNCHKTETYYDLLSYFTGLLYQWIYDEESGTIIYIPELADGEPISEDESHTTWTIKMAEGYTFTDGTPIDAHTFEYSFKMLNDPKLANRNVQVSELKNGEAYLLGECEWEDVGFKLIDDYTFQIEYAEYHEPERALDVKMYFAFIGMGIVHPDTYEATLNADRTESSYGTNMDTIVCSGAYDITGLIEGQYLELTKRTDAGAPFTDVYTPDKVTYKVVSDNNTAIQLFEQGELDRVSAGQAAYDEYPGAHYTYGVYNYGIFLNSVSESQPILRDPNFRYAMFWGIDRTAVVSVSWPICRPCALQYLPDSTMPDPADKENSVLRYYDTPEAKAVRMDGREVTELGYDTELALEYFDKAYEANGSQKITLTAIYSDTGESNKNWAEAIKDQYEGLFGADRFELNLQATPWAVLMEQQFRSKMDYDVCLAGGVYQIIDAPWNDTNWVYSGPYTYNTQYCVIASEEYQQEWDDLFYKCALYDYKWDAQKKLEACARMEEILYNDCSYVPVYVTGSRYFFSSRVEPIMETGDADKGFCLMQVEFK